MRKTFELTDEDLKTLLECSKQSPLVAINCGLPPSPQECANSVWARLGAKMGFQYMTVEPTRQGDKFFTAEPLVGFASRGQS